MLGRASPQPPPTMLPRTRPRQVQGKDGGSQQARCDALRAAIDDGSFPRFRGQQSHHLRNRRQYIPASRDNKQFISIDRVKVVLASLLEGCRPPDGVHTLCTPALPPAAPQPDTFTDTCRCFTSRWRQGMAWPRWSAEQDGGRAHRKYCSAAPSSRRLRRPAESEEDIFWSLRTPTDD